MHRSGSSPWCVFQLVRRRNPKHQNHALSYAQLLALRLPVGTSYRISGLFPFANFYSEQDSNIINFKKMATLLSRSATLIGAAALTTSTRSSSSSCSPLKAANLRIASYNVLSDNLCRGSHYVHSNPEDLENKSRYERVKTHIKSEMDMGSIICLQVSSFFMGNHSFLPAVAPSHHTYLCWRYLRR